MGSLVEFLGRHAVVDFLAAARGEYREQYQGQQREAQNRATG